MSRLGSHPYRLEATMSHMIWFRAPLTCLHCGAEVDARETRLYTSSLNPDPEDRVAEVGDVLELHLDDFEDGYLTLRHPDGDPDVRALEQWACPVCHWTQWARLDFRREDPVHYRLVAVQATSLAPEMVRDVHFISRRLDLWIEANPGPDTDWLAEIIRRQPR